MLARPIGAAPILAWLAKSRQIAPHIPMFDPGGDQTVGCAFVGLKGEVVMPGGTTFNLAVEGKMESDDSEQTSGRVGFKMPL